MNNGKGKGPMKGYDWKKWFTNYDNIFKKKKEKKKYEPKP